jgi:hypothetical protein
MLVKRGSLGHFVFVPIILASASPHEVDNLIILLVFLGQVVLLRSWCFSNG